jgi:hypothetical protein
VTEGKKGRTRTEAYGEDISSLASVTKVGIARIWPNISSNHGFSSRTMRMRGLVDREAADPVD